MFLSVSHIMLAYLVIVMIVLVVRSIVVNATKAIIFDSATGSVSYLPISHNGLKGQLHASDIYLKLFRIGYDEPLSINDFSVFWDFSSPLRDSLALAAHAAVTPGALSSSPSSPFIYINAGLGYSNRSFYLNTDAIQGDNDYDYFSSRLLGNYYTSGTGNDW
jgi:hypothetical protein